MNDTPRLEPLLGVALFLSWIAGVVLAKGWWAALAIFFPPYAIYLFVECLMRAAGLVS